MKERSQRYLTPHPFEDLPYGIYIQYLLAHDAAVASAEAVDELPAHQLWENEGGRVPSPAGD